MARPRISAENPNFTDMIRARGYKDVGALAKELAEEIPASSLYSVSAADNGHKQLKVYLKIAEELGIPLDLWAKKLLGQLTPEEAAQLEYILSGHSNKLSA